MTTDTSPQTDDRDAAFGKILTSRRDELRARLAAIERDFEQPRNPDDDDRALERNNDEVLEGLAESGQAELAAIDAALDRIARGTFGRCAKCGEPIDEQRLRAVPYAPLCRSCASTL